MRKNLLNGSNWEVASGNVLFLWNFLTFKGDPFFKYQYPSQYIV
jgi:hypothetical protein